MSAAETSSPIHLLTRPEHDAEWQSVLHQELLKGSDDPTFTGAELAAWLVRRRHCETTLEAARYGELLRRRDILFHVSHKAPFVVDSANRYMLRADDTHGARAYFFRQLGPLSLPVSYVACRTGKYVMVAPFTSEGTLLHSLRYLVLDRNSQVLHVYSSAHSGASRRSIQLFSAKYFFSVTTLRAERAAKAAAAAAAAAKAEQQRAAARAAATSSSSGTEGGAEPASFLVVPDRAKPRGEDEGLLALHDPRAEASDSGTDTGDDDAEAAGRGDRSRLGVRPARRYFPKAPLAGDSGGTGGTPADDDAAAPAGDEAAEDLSVVVKCDLLRYRRVYFATSMRRKRVWMRELRRAVRGEEPKSTFSHYQLGLSGLSGSRGADAADAVTLAAERGGTLGAGVGLRRLLTPFVSLSPEQRSAAAAAAAARAASGTPDQPGSAGDGDSGPGRAGSGSGRRRAGRRRTGLGSSGMSPLSGLRGVGEAADASSLIRPPRSRPHQAEEEAEGHAARETRRRERRLVRGAAASSRSTLGGVGSLHASPGLQGASSSRLDVGSLPAPAASECGWHAGRGEDEPSLSGTPRSAASFAVWRLGSPGLGPSSLATPSAAGGWGGDDDASRIAGDDGTSVGTLEEIAIDGPFQGHGSGSGRGVAADMPSMAPGMLDLGGMSPDMTPAGTPRPSRHAAAPSGLPNLSRPRHAAGVATTAAAVRPTAGFGAGRGSPSSAISSLPASRGLAAAVAAAGGVSRLAAAPPLAPARAGVRSDIPRNNAASPGLASVGAVAGSRPPMLSLPGPGNVPFPSHWVAPSESIPASASASGSGHRAAGAPPQPRATNGAAFVDEWLRAARVGRLYAGPVRALLGATACWAVLDRPSGAVLDVLGVSSPEHRAAMASTPLPSSVPRREGDRTSRDALLELMGWAPEDLEDAAAAAAAAGTQTPAAHRLALGSDPGRGESGGAATAVRASLPAGPILFPTERTPPVVPPAALRDADPDRRQRLGATGAVIFKAARAQFGVTVSRALARYVRRSEGNGITIQALKRAEPRHPRGADDAMVEAANAELMAGRHRGGTLDAWKASGASKVRRQRRPGRPGSAASVATSHDDGASRRSGGSSTRRPDLRLDDLPGPGSRAGSSPGSRGGHDDGDLSFGSSSDDDAADAIFAAENLSRWDDMAAARASSAADQPAGGPRGTMPVLPSPRAVPAAAQPRAPLLAIAPPQPGAERSRLLQGGRFSSYGTTTTAAPDAGPSPSAPRLPTAAAGDLDSRPRRDSPLGLSFGRDRAASGASDDSHGSSDSGSSSVSVALTNGHRDGAIEAVADDFTAAIGLPSVVLEGLPGAIDGDDGVGGNDGGGGGSGGGGGAPVTPVARPRPGALPRAASASALHPPADVTPTRPLSSVLHAVATPTSLGRTAGAVVTPARPAPYHLDEDDVDEDDEDEVDEDEAPGRRREASTPRGSGPASPTVQQRQQQQRRATPVRPSALSIALSTPTSPTVATPGSGQAAGASTPAAATPAALPMARPSLLVRSALLAGINAVCQSLQASAEATFSTGTASPGRAQRQPHAADASAPDDPPQTDPAARPEGMTPARARAVSRALAASAPELAEEWARVLTAAGAMPGLGAAAAHRHAGSAAGGGDGAPRPAETPLRHAGRSALLPQPVTVHQGAAFLAPGGSASALLCSPEELPARAALRDALRADTLPWPLRETILVLACAGPAALSLGASGAVPGGRLASLAACADEAAAVSLACVVAALCALAMELGTHELAALLHLVAAELVALYGPLGAPAILLCAPEPRELGAAVHEDCVVWSGELGSLAADLPPQWAGDLGDLARAVGAAPQLPFCRDLARQADERQSRRIRAVRDASGGALPPACGWDAMRHWDVVVATASSSAGGQPGEGNDGSAHGGTSGSRVSERRLWARMAAREPSAAGLLSPGVAAPRHVLLRRQAAASATAALDSALFLDLAPRACAVVAASACQERALPHVRRLFQALAMPASSAIARALRPVRAELRREASLGVPNRVLRALQAAARSAAAARLPAVHPRSRFDAQLLAYRPAALAVRALTTSPAWAMASLGQQLRALTPIAEGLCRSHSAYVAWLVRGGLVLPGDPATLDADEELQAAARDDEKLTAYLEARAAAAASPGALEAGTRGGLADLMHRSRSGPHVPEGRSLLGDISDVDRHMFGFEVCVAMDRAVTRCGHGVAEALEHISPGGTGRSGMDGLVLRDLRHLLADLQFRG